MTDFEKIRNYYKYFDEENRLKWDASGKLEYEMTLRILDKYLPEKGCILDLGGATGVYSFPLAEKGYEVYLADISPDLLEQARKKDVGNILKGYDVVNATDLSIYEDSFFDVIIAFGPFYHLMEEGERVNAIKEIHRVIKREGIVMAAFIPYLSGSIAIVDRYIFAPEQVDVANLAEVFKSGKFVNHANVGFQEGYYAESDEIEKLFAESNFDTIGVRSVRGFAYGKEDAIYSITDVGMKEKVFELIEDTSMRKEIIETCGHAVYIGKKK